MVRNAILTMHHKMFFNGSYTLFGSEHMPCVC